VAVTTSPPYLANGINDMSLPIEAVLPALKQVLRTHIGAVVQAPPGAGKTTRVPLALADEAWLTGQRILMLEPRRVAARAAAARMASLLGERVGETVGYRIRLDKKIGPTTRIEVVTEGILTRMLQTDPALEGVGLVIFDEFHERSIHADLGLALCLQVQDLLRDDLRLLVMSATLDGEAVAALMHDAPVVTSEGRLFPVETHYLSRASSLHLEQQVVQAIIRAHQQHNGNLLVFLPGASEIRRVAERLETANLPASTHTYPLYGNLPQHVQDQAIRPSPKGTRKIVLATPIAETSLTIEGIEVVIDSGLRRRPRFDPRSGMTRLETVPISQASSDQRRGRAGRLGPGHCYRLWQAHDQHQRAPFDAPEILEADLAPLALDLAQWGISDPTELRWLDTPPTAAFEQARDLLTQLGALGMDGSIAHHGQALAAFPLHPRLAHMILTAQRLGLGALACDVAALLTERDLFKSQSRDQNPDLRLRLDALLKRRMPDSMHGFLVDRGVYRRVTEASRQWKRQRKLEPASPEDVEAAGLLLAFAYPDRIAQRKPESIGRFRLHNGRAAVLPSSTRLAEADYLGIAHLDGQKREARIFLGAPLSPDLLFTHFADAIQHEVSISWNTTREAIDAHAIHSLGALVLKTERLVKPDAERVTEVLLEAIAASNLALLPWTQEARFWQQRMQFMYDIHPDWLDVSDAALQTTLTSWLGPYLTGISSKAALQRLDLANILQNQLAWSDQQRLNREAPTHLTVPSGSNIRLDYTNPTQPILAVRLQEMFGATETPRIGGGTVPVLLHLLSPARRPVQITHDLANFWATTYFDVKKDMKGRYPKHVWPDDPLQEPATRYAKRRKRA